MKRLIRVGVLLGLLLGGVANPDIGAALVFVVVCTRGPLGGTA